MKTWIFLLLTPLHRLGFPVGSDSKETACNAGDMGSIPGWGISPGEGNGNPFQYSRLGNPMDTGAWWATGHGIAESGTTERLSTHACRLMLLGRKPYCKSHH